MYGWDVVYASKISALNPGLSGDTISFDESFNIADNNVEVSASLNAWQITTGGSDALVFFKVPCSSIKISNGDKTFRFKDGYFLIQTNLKFVTDSNNISHLKIDTGEGNAKVLSAAFSDSGFGAFEIYARKGFQNWVNKQDSFPYNFISIKTYSESDNSDVIDFKASKVNYAYINTSEEDGILAVLCKIAGSNNIEETLQQVSPNAIPSGGSSVLINKSIIENQINNSNNIPDWAGSKNSRILIEDNLVYQLH